MRKGGRKTGENEKKQPRERKPRGTRGPSVRAGKEAERPASTDAALALAREISTILAEKHGMEIVILDVKDFTSVTEFFVVVSGNNRPHIHAMFTELQSRLKREGTMCYRRSGIPESGWMVLDYIDVVVHILLEEKRRYYAIEDLFPDARRVMPSV